MRDKFGYITQVIGPVVDVAFEGEDNELPPIYSALKIEREDSTDLIVEVEQHIGENTVRCVAMDTTDGLRRGMKVIDLQRPLAMPTGSQIKGRLMNVIGETIDHLPNLDYKDVQPIHRPAPAFEDGKGLCTCKKTDKKAIDSGACTIPPLNMTPAASEPWWTSRAARAIRPWTTP